ncbi:hypothetical protein, partial [Kribbella jejuensis]|uniref:hypothetical protein n=1 Tax=Kribbella jejuensis TaxID=236068 RepID=UPI0031CE81BC
PPRSTLHRSTLHRSTLRGNTRRSTLRGNTRRSTLRGNTRRSTLRGSTRRGAPPTTHSRPHLAPGYLVRVCSTRRGITLRGSTCRFSS